MKILTVPPTSGFLVSFGSQKFFLHPNHQYLCPDFIQTQIERSYNYKLNFSAPTSFKRFTGIPRKKKKRHGILISRTGGIGDLLLISSLIRELEKFHVPLAFMTQPKYFDIFNLIPIKRYYGLLCPVASVKDLRYYITFEGVIEKDTEHNWYDLIEKVTKIKLSQKIPYIKVPPREKVNLYNAIKKEICKDSNDIFALVHYYSGSPVRRMDPAVLKGKLEKVRQQVAKELDLKLKFVFCRFDRYEKNKLTGWIWVRTDTITDLAALCYVSDLIISTDTCPVHFAGGYQKKALGIYGPFPAWARITTYPTVEYVEPVPSTVKTLVGCEKIPCFTHGHSPCPYSKNLPYSPCFDFIQWEEMAEKVINLLKGDKK